MPSAVFCVCVLVVKFARCQMKFLGGGDEGFEESSGLAFLGNYNKNLTSYAINMNIDLILF